MANRAQNHLCASISSWIVALAYEPQFPTSLALYPDPSFHQQAANGIAVKEVKDSYINYGPLGTDSIKANKRHYWSYSISCCKLFRQCQWTKKQKILIVSCNHQGKIYSGELFSVETCFMFHLPTFLVKLERDFQEYVRDFSNTNSTETKGIFAFSCFSLSSWRHSFHQIHT